MSEQTEHYGPTRDCKPNCTGCVLCMRVATLIQEIRHDNQDAALELARRVEKLMGNNTLPVGSAGYWVRDKLEPVPAVALDAMEEAVKAYSHDEDVDGRGDGI